MRRRCRLPSRSRSPKLLLRPEPIAAEEQTTEAEAKPHRPHGLWDVMYTDVLSGAAVGLTPEPAAPLQPQPRSLWSVMGAGNEAKALEPAATKAEVAEQPPVTTVPNPLPTTPLYMEPPTPRPVRLSRDDLWLIVLGLLAICLSVLAILPASGSRFLLPRVGLLQCCARPRHGWSRGRRDGSARRRESVVSSGFWESLPARQSSLRSAITGATTSPRDTRKHLEQIGHALDKYHAEQGAYPVGGTTFRDKQQRERGLHGWMTALLPYVGANSVYQQIDLKKPYDDPVNRAAMSLPVESYYAAGGKRLPVGPGFAASHFAGVGGEIKDPEGATHPAGIFTQNRAIKRDEVRDGLSHTLIAGKLPPIRHGAIQAIGGWWAAELTASRAVSATRPEMGPPCSSPMAACGFFQIAPTPCLRS